MSTCASPAGSAAPPSRAATLSAPNMRRNSTAAPAGFAAAMMKRWMPSAPLAWLRQASSHTSPGVRCWQKNTRPAGAASRSSRTVRKAASFGPAGVSTGRENACTGSTGSPAACRPW